MREKIGFVADPPIGDAESAHPNAHPFGEYVIARASRKEQAPLAFPVLEVGLASFLGRMTWEATRQDDLGDEAGREVLENKGQCSDPRPPT